MTLSRQALIEFALLGALLAAPFTGHLLGLGGAAAENRHLADRPALPASTEALKAFPGKLDAYLDDHFGFRSALVSKLDMVRFYILGESTAPQITRGKDGFLFLNSHSAAEPDRLIKETCRIEDAAAQAQQTAKAVSEIAAAYRPKGIPVSVIVIPNAARIYGDELPASTPRALVEACRSEEPDRYRRAAAALEDEDLTFLYPLAEFRRWRAEYAVYPRRFFHWNGETPWRTAGLLFQRLGLVLPDTVPRRHKQETSDLRGLLGGFHLNADVYGPDPTQTGAQLCGAADCMDPALFALTGQGVQVTVTRHPGAPLGRVILVSDSFGGAFTQGLARGYREVIHLYPLGPGANSARFYQRVIPSFAPGRLVLAYHDFGAENALTQIAALLGAALPETPAPAPVEARSR